MPVTQQDRFHIGSCTKSMTATLAAVLVDRHRLSWKTTIGSVFPKIRMNPAYRSVTLEQLLKHRGGLPADVPVLLWNKLWGLTTSPRQQRLALLRDILSTPPAAKPGSKFIYSNAGYAVAGAMMEKLTGESWESMMRKMLFAPLGMTTAGFGAPAKTPEPDQPLGHVMHGDSITAVEPGPGDDNPAAIAPAGAVHCSIGDLATYAMFHLHGTHSGRKMLESGTFRKLHAPAGVASYAMGWIVVERDWAGGTALTHTGSNTMFVATIWLAPEKDFAVVIATNLGGDRAIQACDAVAAELIQQYLTRQR
jgi:CubicO group peptidase (beta-lactamase class C family)